VLGELGIATDPLFEIAMRAGEDRAATTTTSSNASCTRTSTSIPASF
jgi:hypothetical protein